MDFQLKSIETAQLFSIGISMVSLAWCFSEYNSTRKNMLLDVTESPCSRMIMCLYMLLQVKFNNRKVMRRGRRIIIPLKVKILAIDN